jgi:hypothetical protein
LARIDQLVASYQRHVGLPLKANLPLSQRVWFVVYAPEDERRMMNRIQEFELATREAGLGWQRWDLTGAFADWIDTFDASERDGLLADQELVEAYADPGLTEFLRGKLKEMAAAVPPAEAGRTVFAVTGLMELYDFVHVSDVIDPEQLTFPGVLLVFFPGEREANTYRFLGARDGWNYLAVPILGGEN